MIVVVKFFSNGIKLVEFMNENKLELKNVTIVKHNNEPVFKYDLYYEMEKVK